jgi:serine protease Do
MRNVGSSFRWLLPALLLLSSVALAAPADSPPQGGWVGVMLGRPEPQSLDVDGEPANAGVPIRFVIDESPAADAGLRARDRILSVNGNPVRSTEELLAALRLEQPGNWIPLGIDRRGEERDVRVRLAARPQSFRELRTRRAWVGVELIDLTPALRRHFGAPEDAGAMIADIEPGSPAESAGFEVGDVVFEFEGDRIASARDFVEQVASGGVGNDSEFGVARSGAVMVLEAVLELDPASADR